MPVRIVHVSDCYAPRTGGIETQVRALAAAQAARGHEVHVLTATPGQRGHGGVEADGDVRVHRLGTALTLGVPVNPAAGRHMAALLRERRPDVVHVHAGLVSPFAFDGARTAVRVGAPVAITWHCMLDGAVTALRAGARLSGWRAAPVALSAVSRAAAERVRAVFGREVAVVPNGVDLGRWQPHGPRERPSGPLRCVATMRLAPRKRPGALVRLVGEAVAQLPAGALHLDLVGEGSRAGAVRRQVHRRGLQEAVTLHGRLSREDLRERYTEADVFLAPAELEAFGIAGLEARAAGLVVIGRSGTGLTEYLTHGRDGLLVDDDAAMTRALVRLARDDDELGRLRRTAREDRPVHGWDLTVEAALEEYSRARALVPTPAGGTHPAS